MIHEAINRTRHVLDHEGILTVVNLTVEKTMQIPDLAPMDNGAVPGIDVIWVNGGPYSENILFVSDLHKDLEAALDYLEGVIDPGKWTFISCGDMAGTGRFGEDASPETGYRRIRDTFFKFYYVAGNHDVLTPEIRAMTNRDGSFCNLDGHIVQIGGRSIAGVGGIIGKAGKLNRISQDDFCQIIRKLHKPHTLITHQPVLIPGFEPELRLTGIEEQVTALSPAIHVFGHAHLNPVWVSQCQTTYLNCDGRILLLVSSAVNRGDSHAE
jgi:Icc-related predicted phosphoesterase